MAELVGGLAGTLQGKLTGLVNQGQGFIDKWFPPERRAELWAKFQKFIAEKPMLASFLLSQIAISGLPLALFTTMTLTVGIFSLLAAILIALLGALLFIVFCIGLALIILLPTLFFTTLFASFVWLWGMGAYYIVKFFNKKEIPGIHTDLKEGLLGGGGKKEEESENERLDALNPETKGAQTRKGDGEEKREKSQPNGSAKKGGSPVNDVTDNVGKRTGVDVGNGVGDLKNKANLGDVQKRADVGEIQKTANVDGVTKKLPTGVLG